MSRRALTIPRRGRIAPVVVIGVFLLLAVAGGGAWYLVYGIRPPEPPPPTGEPAELPAQVHQFCGGCHAYPPAETFPRSAWKEEVERGYRFFRDSNLPLVPPPIDQVIRYYEVRAPEQLPPI